jgi:predicted nucleic acid-binding Zn ribbon protein
MTWRPLPKRPGDDHPHELARSLDDIARSIGAPPAEALSVVFSRWEEVVGPAVAAHSHPVSLLRSTLVVSVDHPAWATQLRYLGSTILARITEVVGHEVASRLEVRVGPK